MFSDPLDDSIFSNKYVEITRNDNTDNLVFQQDGEKLKYIGDFRNT